MFRGAVGVHCLVVLLLCVVYGGICDGQANSVKETRVNLEDVTVITSDDALRKSTEQIVFLRGVVIYDDTFKNPISILKSSFGKSYSCRGIEKHKGSDVLVAAVPQWDIPVDRSVGGVRTDDGRSVSLVYARVVGVTKLPKR